ncbi:histidine-type phosphatase [Oleisolibacter albus]|uniref:histidine-type phosphatase n=1 Tax=Oleisolibacter albus TaxID=2171757 RepID=UPI000DF31940|nr:histidine-type phosphatase [Oleisolibacter albus]
MRLRPLLAGAILALSVLAPAVAAPAAEQPPPGDLALDRVVLLLRHGVRAPLPTEAAVTGLTEQPLPVWDTPASHLTPHGYEASVLLGRYDRQLLARWGLLPATGCPTPAQLSIWTNTAERTIRTGQGLAEGLAPGCPVEVGHLPGGQHDPLFEPEPALTGFDPAGAVAAIRAEIGDPQALTAPYGAEIRLMERALGCDRRPVPCDIANSKATLSVSADGRGIDLLGPIYITSGTAQVFILQYLEGMPLDQVAWGRLSVADLGRISRLHALLFDVYARPAVMARRTAIRLAPHIADRLSDPAAPALTVLVGHDNTIAAITSLLGVHFQMDGYGQDDPPIGGGLRFEVWRDRRSGDRSVRLVYQAQTMDQIRALTPLDPAHPPATQILVPCGPAAVNGRCPLTAVTDRLHLP